MGLSWLGSPPAFLTGTEMMCNCWCWQKRTEMVTEEMPSPSLSESAMKKAVSKEEVARHCRRMTRGEAQTVKNIEELLFPFLNATDTLGIPLLKAKEMEDIWKEQKKHIGCIQDHPGEERPSGREEWGSLCTDAQEGQHLCRVSASTFWISSPEHQPVLWISRPTFWMGSPGGTVLGQQRPFRLPQPATSVPSTQGSNSRYSRE